VQPTGECTVTYCDHEAQMAALKMFNGQTYGGLHLVPILMNFLLRPKVSGQLFC
jgi:hypothetical protein